MSTFGLPRHVLSFLRHMEAYKDFLKWDICESSHKLTLMLSWNFRKHAGRETLWGKLQRTLKLNRSHSQDSAIPQNLSRFLEGSPKKSNVKSPPSGSSFTSPLSWARISSISVPSRWKHHHSASSARNSFHESRSMHTSLQQDSPSRMSLPMSPSRYSWPGTANTGLPTQLSEDSHCTPITSTPDSTRSDRSPNPSGIQISYRMGEEMDQSLENIAEQVKEKSKEELKAIHKEWNDSIKNWHQILLQDDAVNTSSELTDSESELNLQQVNQTVQKCLQTCDSILDKHSTLIL